LKTLTRHN
jgi:hypothetical protein